jgi:hypothetical protein
MKMRHTHLKETTQPYYSGNIKMTVATLELQLEVSEQELQRLRSADVRDKVQGFPTCTSGARSDTLAILRDGLRG